MRIYINDEGVYLEGDMHTVQSIVQNRNIPMAGTAVALNDRIVRKPLWNTTLLQDGDRLTIINMAFGG